MKTRHRKTPKKYRNLAKSFPYISRAAIPSLIFLELRESKKNEGIGKAWKYMSNLGKGLYLNLGFPVLLCFLGALSFLVLQFITAISEKTGAPKNI